MKERRKVLKYRTLNLLPILPLLIIIFFAFSKSRYIFREHNRIINTPDIFRPILDSTILCSRFEAWSGEYEISFFYIVEHMPRPKIPIDVIENILEKEILFNAQELYFHDTIGFQCVVNCNGMAGDFQILKCPEEFVNIGCQVLNGLRTHLAEWDPPIQRGENVDILALIAVKIDKGQFEIIAPFY